METPICITDAQTFTDHIHEIKYWIYNGHLRLVVPSSTSDKVEQLYLKSIEPKPVPKETAKPKPFGKPAKKEYPAFNINPRLAKDFLSRLQAGKNGELGALGRQTYAEEENHDALKFQQMTEQYTPWKDVDVAEEVVESPKEPPTTWAEALRRKQNIANGISEKMKPKGPAKPKLVAKTPGGDNSPWKIQRNAPTISANEVPSILRPMMSCALWHIHESIDRNDANQLFLLCDQPHIQDVAKKLNIITRSTKELAAQIHKKTPQTDANVFGDLERDFGVLAKPRVKQSNGRIADHTPPTVKADSDVLYNGDGDTSQGAQAQKVADLDERDNRAHSPVQETKSRFAPSQTPEETILQIADDQVRLSVPPPEEKSVPTPEENSLESSNGRASPASGSLITAKLDGSTLKASALTEETIDTRPVYQSHKQQSLEPCPGLETKSLTVASPDQKALLRDNSNDSVPTSIIPQAAAEPTGTHIELPAAEVAQDDPDDSEEEKIVFQPKRMSAQRKTPSRPSTASGQPQATPVTQVTRPVTPSSTAPLLEIGQDARPSTTHAQISPKAKTASPKPPKHIAHGHQKLPAGPTVIDPDAFGRGFAVNTAPSTRGGPRSMRVRHSPHSSIHNGQFNHPHPGSSHRSPRVSPPRPQSTKSPGQTPRVLEQTVPISDNQIHGQAPVESQANIQAPPKPTESTRPIALPSINGQRRPRTPAQDPEFTRNLFTRPAPLAGPQLRQNGPKPNYGPIGSGMRRPDLGAQDMSKSRVNLPRTSKPTLFEPMIDHTRAPRLEDIEPRSRVPEVQYVLKSGSTREAARGKGKLWVG